MTDLFDSFLTAYPLRVQDLARGLRALILDVIPTAIEQVDPPSKIVAYGFDRTYAGLICAIAPYQAYVNLMLARGASLPDPTGLLKGTGKRARHIRITDEAQLADPAVRTLLEAALACA